MRIGFPALAGGVAVVMGLLSTPASAQRADVIHWWTSGGEAKAVGVFAQEYGKRGGTWIDSAVVGGPAARAAAINRIAGGNPPTAMQWNNLVSVRQLAEQGLLANLDDIAKRENWAANLPPLANERIRNDGHVIAVPLNIQAANMLFYSTKVFSDLGLQPPKNWDEFFTVADKIKAAGIIPLALGVQPPQVVALFQTVLLGSGGADLYRQVWAQHDAKAAGGPEVIKAFEILRRLTGYVDDGSPNRRWNDTTYLVQNNKAAMQIVGDWAKGEFIAGGLQPGQGFGCTLAPGNAGYYITVIDVFAFPKATGAEQVAAREKLAATVMDPAVQVAFNQQKGGLPARRDATMPALDDCSRLGAEIIAQHPENLLPNVGMAYNADAEGQLGDLMIRYWTTPRMTAKDAAAELSDIVAGAER
ncbi:ABC transporter substrate-binding protein [Roseomonas elaeocarpi]|uniref:Probable sugar-binding periplasmic protein n=1 Tax=Roseomonas elaeocarpi TaxID=907779 RepID=A0ABV6JN34_9PROT